MAKLSRLFITLVIGSCCLQASNASIVQYAYSANVAFEIRGNQLATVDQSLFPLGISISGTFDYDTAATPIMVEGATAYASIFNFSGSIAGNNFFDPSGNTVVINNRLDLEPDNPDNPLIDFFSVNAEGGPIADLTGFTLADNNSLFTLVNVRLFWFSQFGDFLENENQPAELPPMADTARLALDFVSVDDSSITHTVFAEGLSLTASPVPLPGAAWLLLSALGLLGTTRKKLS